MLEIVKKNVGNGYTITGDTGSTDLDLDDRLQSNAMSRFIKSVALGDNVAVEYYSDYYTAKGMDPVAVSLFKRLAEEVVSYYRDVKRGDVSRLKNMSKAMSILKEYLSRGGSMAIKDDEKKVKDVGTEDGELSAEAGLDDDVEVIPVEDSLKEDVPEMEIREVKRASVGTGKKKVSEQKVPLRQISVPPHVLTLYEEAVRNGYNGTLEQFVTDSIERAAEVDFGLNVAVVKTLSGRNKNREIVVGKSMRERRLIGAGDDEEEGPIGLHRVRAGSHVYVDPEIEMKERELERRRRQLELLRKEKELQRLEQQIYGEGVGEGMQEFLKKFEEILKENAMLKERLMREESEKRFEQMRAEIEGLKQVVQSMVYGGGGSSTKAHLKAAVVNDLSKTVNTVQDLINMFAKEVILPKLRKDMELMTKVMERSVEASTSSASSSSDVNVEPAKWTERDEAMRLKEYYELARMLGIELPEGISAQEANKLIQERISKGVIGMSEEVDGNGS